VFNLAGGRIRTLTPREIGSQEWVIEWDGRLANGWPAASGIYFLKVESGSQTRVRKLILTR
jgi:hypothetical protein